MMILIITLKTFLQVYLINQMINRRIIIIVSIIIVLVSIVTIYLVPSDTIIPIPNPNEKSTRNNSTPPQGGLSVDSQ
jgi:hypothetical protein